MNKILKFAIYGCGVIARTHRLALRDVVGAELYACADISAEAARSFAEEEGEKRYV